MTIIRTGFYSSYLLQSHTPERKKPSTENTSYQASRINQLPTKRQRLYLSLHLDILSNLFKGTDSIREPLLFLRTLTYSLIRSLGTTTTKNKETKHIIKHYYKHPRGKAGITFISNNNPYKQGKQKCKHKTQQKQTKNTQIKTTQTTTQLILIALRGL